MELKELKWLWDNWTKEEGEEESGMLIKIVLIVEKTTFRSILFCQLQKIYNKDWNDCVEWKGLFLKRTEEDDAFFQRFLFFYSREVEAGKKNSDFY